MTVPSPWVFVLGALATWRLFAVIARDVILDDLGIRDRLFPEGTKRRDWSECPYCAGFWASLLTTGLWSVAAGWPGVISFLAVWWATSAAVVLIEIAVDYTTAGRDLAEARTPPE